MARCARCKKFMFFKSNTGYCKNCDLIVQQEEQKRREEEERKARERKAEEERLAKERQAEEERLAKERQAEEERLAKERQAEEERLAKERQAEEERLAKERQAEEERQANARQAQAAWDSVKRMVELGQYAQSIETLEALRQSAPDWAARAESRIKAVEDLRQWMTAWRAEQDEIAKLESKAAPAKAKAAAPAAPIPQAEPAKATPAIPAAVQAALNKAKASCDKGCYGAAVELLEKLIADFPEAAEAIRSALESAQTNRKIMTEWYIAQAGK